MKKIVIALIAPLVFGSIALAEPTRFGSDNGVVIGGQSDQGTVTVGAGQLFVTNPTLNAPVIYLAPATASATAYENATSISTTTLVAGATTLTLANADYTDIITPRNVVAVVSFAVGKATTTVAGTLLVTGKNQRGESATETLTVSTTSATGSVAWSTITSLKWTITSITGRVDTDNALLDVGSGTKIGLPANLNASTEVLKVIENGSLTTTYTLSTTYDTITFVNAPDGSKNYQVWLKPQMR